MNSGIICLFAIRKFVSVKILIIESDETAISKISWQWTLRQGNFEHKHGFTPLTSSPINPVQLPSWRFEPYLKSATCFMSKVTLSSGSIFFRRSGINPSNWADPPCFWITNGSSCKTRDETFEEIIWLICLIGYFFLMPKS